MYVYTSSMTYEQAEQYILSRCDNPQFLSWTKQQFPLLTETEIRSYLKNLSPATITELAANFGKNCELSYERRREIIDTDLRAVCFSNPAKVNILDEILLWSHYAQKHGGIRIGFEFPNKVNEAFQITEMSYQKNRVKVDFSFKIQIEAFEAALHKSAITKSIAWEYEREVRLFTKIEYCEPREIRTATSTVLEYFLPVNAEWVKSVDFGALCPNHEIQEVVSLLKSNYPHVICRKAEFHKEEYALAYKEI